MQQLITPVISALSFVLLIFFFISNAAAQTTDTDQNMSVGGNIGVQPDLFTGQAAASIPIEVPPGRHGIQPALSLQYSSSNGNGWIGMGWKLDLGGVERNTRFGLNYSGDDYVFRLSSANTDLVNIGSSEYRAKIEGGFSRVRKLTAADGQPYWEATDKKGIRYLFGQSPASRLADPANAGRIFKWCLDQVIDLNVNYMTVTYFGDQGQGYVDHIDYTGNASTQPTNTVKFYRESRGDASPMYMTNYLVVTAYRLKTIDVLTNGNRVRAYKLTYTASTGTGRSQLSGVQQYGKDATVDGSGVVTGGSALPSSTFSYTAAGTTFNTPTQWLGDNGPAGATYNQNNQYVGDFNGDGKQDWMYYNNTGWYVALSNGNGFNAPTLWLSTNGPSGVTLGSNYYYQFVGDFNGDGKTDYLYYNNGWYVALSNGNGFNPPTLWLGSTGPSGPTYNQNYQYVGDFNGDGKMDYMYNYLGWYVALSNGNGFNPPTQWLPDSGPSGPTYNLNYQYVGDFNGDGKMDWMYNYNGWYVALSNGNGFNPPTQWLPDSGPSGPTWNQYHQYVGDFNGDGKMDWMYNYNGWYVALSNGNGFNPPTQWLPDSGPSGPTWSASPPWHQFIGDFNGDGKTDYMYNYNGWYVALSNGSGFNTPTLWLPDSGPSGPTFNQFYERVGDFNGDGKTDYMYNYLGWYVALQNDVGDLLSAVNNGIGGITTIRFVPSTLYSNTQLPFPVQTVNFIKTDDGNGNVAVTYFDYNGGFYHIGERDFRGFNFAKASGPSGPNGEQTITETWFHQGNDLAVDTNTPNVPDGYMKGKPYRMNVSDGQGHLYTGVTTTYASGPSSAPFFNPPLQVDSLTCDGGSCGKHTQTVFTYDAYGNVKREDQYGDLSDPSDDRTVIRSFLPNTTDWIVGLPINEAIYKGIGPGNGVASTDFYYDGVTNCAVPSTNQSPTQGNLTRVVRWLSGGTSPETRMAYDAYGNLICTRDANGNTSTISYDSSATFPKIAINALGHQKITQYYGVDGVPMDAGLYGQVRSATDPNGATVTTIYDVFGRKTQVYLPDGGWTVFAYNSFGTVGAQHVQVNTAAGLSSWTYFDGLGRTITEKKTGPDSKTIALQTQYNARGTVSRNSLPYFFGIEAPSWKTFAYDPMGRVIQIINSDGSRVSSCTSNWVTVAIDANNHRKRETHDAYGRLIKVDEYLGNWSSCTTDAAAPYATTTYQYDVLGNLRFVTDAKGNQSEMRYDTLSRKTFMHDADMGNWTYVYDAAGNLTQQTDAKAQNIYFQYDVLNRRTQKDYGTQGNGDVRYNYDGATSNGRGRLTSVQDSSGSVIFYYDRLGRTTRSDKSLDGSTYITQTVYDLAGRVSSVIYPDPNYSVVTYAYNGPVLDRIYDTTTTYARYGGYNALGQPATLTPGNSVVTTYTYSTTGNSTCPQQNFRPCTIKTQLGANPAYQDLIYNYDTGGNVTWIADAVNGSQSFGYDELNRLGTAAGPYGNFTYGYDEIANMTSNPQLGSYAYPASGAGSIRPHAVTNAGSNSYWYDENGNRTWGWDGTNWTGLWWDYENRPQWIWTQSTGAWTGMVYDGDGGRVKKLVWNPNLGWTTTKFIGKLYECEETACSRYIFAGDKRVAVIPDNGGTYYYHSDHLGSTSVMTDASGAQVQSLTYYPYGATRANMPMGSPAVDVPYKYTGKELDTSTGLYFYEARYYDPVLGRFISADTIVPNARDPQAFNRYSYVENNPLRYNDPTGHFKIGKALFKFATWGYAYPVVDMVLKTSPYVQAAGAFLVSIYAPPAAPWYSAYVTQLNRGSTGDMLKSAAITYASAQAFGAIDATDWSSGAKALGHGVVGGVSAQLQGGKFEEGFISAGASRLAMSGWEYMRDTINEGAIASGNRSNCRFGPCTAGSRVTLNDDEIHSATGFANQGMTTEVVPGHPELRQPHGWDWLPGAIDVVEAISKTHDFGNSWTYQGGFYAPSNNGWANDAFNLYSMTTMLPAAAYTGAAFMRGTPAVDLAVDRSKYK